LLLHQQTIEGVGVETKITQETERDAKGAGVGAALKKRVGIAGNAGDRVPDLARDHVMDAGAVVVVEAVEKGTAIDAAGVLIPRHQHQ
jgi:hypothetical protein